LHDPPDAEIPRPVESAPRSIGWIVRGDALESPSIVTVHRAAQRPSGLADDCDLSIASLRRDHDDQEQAERDEQTADQAGS
jgi:hypothetical protein